VRLMRYLVIYDITDDRLRARVAEILKNYGLKRIQKSAFIGNLTRAKLSSIVVDVKMIVVDDNLKIFPLCDVDYRGLISIGKEYKGEPEEKVVFY
jgi:CRISPR-associated protein Cas2